MISKLLWPQRHGSRDRQLDMTPVRQELGYDDTTRLLLSDVALRNDLEHYNERLYRWHPQPVVVDMNIGAKSMFGITGVSHDDYARHFDPTTNTFSIRGKEVDLQELVTEVQSVKQGVAAALERRYEQRITGSQNSPYTPPP